MREFFKGWRRKAGCVLLLLAGVSTNLWLASFGEWTYTITFRANRIDSSHGWIEFYDENAARMVDVEIGNGLSTTKEVNLPVLSVPYAAVTIPMTLLSACLILWKPRQRTEPPHA